MRKTSIMIGITILAVLICGTSFARPRLMRKSITLGTNTTGTAEFAFSGYIDTVYVAVSDGTSTGTVTLAYAPSIGSTAVNVATNNVTDEKIWRPVVDRTDINGAAITGDEPSRFIMVGETLTLTVSSSPTNLVWTGAIAYDDGK